MEAFAALFAGGFVSHQVSAAAPGPPSGMNHMDQKAGVVALFAARVKAIPDLKVTIETSLAEGDKVAASFAYEGTQSGPYYGVEPTGKRLFFASCDIFRVEAGQIVEHWGMGDIAGVIAQIRG
jgi:predicted ester cyclase